MIVKIHNNQRGKKVIAVCDKEILGKKFEEGDLQLNLSSNFYKGEIMEEEQLKKEAKDAYIINITGEKSVDFFLNNKLISKENILFVKKIPYAQCMII